MKDREDKTIKIILKGWKRAFHRRFHQLGNEYSSGTFGPFSRSLLSASVKLKPAKNSRTHLTQTRTRGQCLLTDQNNENTIFYCLVYMYITVA